jgi:hypothetical protein
MMTPALLYLLKISSLFNLLDSSLFKFSILPFFRFTFRFLYLFIPWISTPGIRGFSVLPMF